MKLAQKGLMGKHLKKPMAYTELYGCRPVWWQQLENDMADWTDMEVRMEYRSWLKLNYSYKNIICGKC